MSNFQSVPGSHGKYSPGQGSQCLLWGILADWVKFTYMHTYIPTVTYLFPTRIGRLIYSTRYDPNVSFTASTFTISSCMFVSFEYSDLTFIQNVPNFFTDHPSRPCPPHSHSSYKSIYLVNHLSTILST